MRSSVSRSSTSFSEAPREISSGTIADGKMTTPRSGRIGRTSGTATSLTSSSKP